MSLVVGVIGHVDHGKTALVQALTGRDTDRLREEKERGISIVLGFAHLDTGGTQVDLIDMPGHERFVRTMVAGATGIDAVLLVVAANEAIKPQTLEHVEIASLLGIRRAVVAITKADLVTPVEAQAAADVALALLTTRGIAAAAPVLTSAVTGEGIAELREALARMTAGQTARRKDGLLFLPIDRAFTVPGHGAVITGTLRGTSVAAGDTLELLPSGKPMRVRSVQVHGETVTSASPGQRVALNLRGAELAELPRGAVLAAPDTLRPSEWLTVALRSLAGAPALRNGARLTALLGTAELQVRLRLLEGDELEPGVGALAQLRFADPVAVPAGEHVVLRLPAPVNTVAGGRILEPSPRRLRRRDATILRRLARLRDLAPEAIVAAEAQACTTLRSLSEVSGLAAWRVGELLQRLPVAVTRTGAVLPQDQLDTLTKALPGLLAAQAEGLSQTALQSVAPAPPPVLDEALNRLIAAGKIARRASRYLVPRPELDRRRSAGEADLAARLAALLRKSGLTPPLPGELIRDHHAQRAIDRLLRDGTVVRAVDRAKGKELLFHRDAIVAAQGRLAPLLGAPGLLVGEIAAALGVSRKFTMPLLDHLDTTRFTLRVGDRRVLHPSREPKKEGQVHETAQEHV
jgi:selenocysteine-specific elongation factor